MAICTGDSIVQNIERTECIGNSLTKINNNFKNLDITSCELGNDIDGLTSLINTLSSTQLALASIQTSFVGSVAYFPTTTPPTGWLVLNGQSISRNTYSNLWTFAQSSGNLVTDTVWYSTSAIGSFSQGNGSTTFRIPDLRGEFVRSWDNSRGIDSGRTLGSWQKGTIFGHDNTSSTYGVVGVVYTGGEPPQNTTLSAVGLDNYDVTQYPNIQLGSVASTSNTTTLPNWPANAGSSGITRPRNVSLLACIKF